MVVRAGRGLCRSDRSLCGSVLYLVFTTLSSMTHADVKGLILLKLTILTAPYSAFSSCDA